MIKPRYFHNTTFYFHLDKTTNYKCQRISLPFLLNFSYKNKFVCFIQLVVTSNNYQAFLLFTMGSLGMKNGGVASPGGASALVSPQSINYGSDDGNFQGMVIISLKVL